LSTDCAAHSCRATYGSHRRHMRPHLICISKIIIPSDASITLTPVNADRPRLLLVGTQFQEFSMSDTPARQRYPNSAILLHWLVLLLVVAAYACILLRVNYERGSDIREGLKAWHFTLGLSVLAATFLRAGLRAFVWKTPPIMPEPPRALHLLSVAAH